MIVEESHKAIARSDIWQVIIVTLKSAKLGACYDGFIWCSVPSSGAQKSFDTRVLLRRRIRAPRSSASATSRATMPLCPPFGAVAVASRRVQRGLGDANEED